HERSLVESIFEGLGCIRESAALYAPVPLVRTKAAAQDVVLEVRLIAKLGTHVLIEHSGIGRTDGAHARIVACGFRDLRTLAAGEAAIQAAHRLVLVAQKFFDEVRLVDTQIALLDVALAQS